MEYEYEVRDASGIVVARVTGKGGIGTAHLIARHWGWGSTIRQHTAPRVWLTIGIVEGGGVIVAPPLH